MWEEEEGEGEGEEEGGVLPWQLVLSYREGEEEEGMAEGEGDKRTVVSTDYSKRYLYASLPRPSLSY